MRQRHFVMILLLLLLELAACSPGHTGNNEIAFLRAGQLWSIDPDGANAFAIVSGGEAVTGYSWSPNHQIVVFRQLDSTFAESNAAKHLPEQAVTGQIADVPSTLNTVGVDGGTPISIALSSPDVRYNTPFWISNGTRLLYRQEGLNSPVSPADVTWWVSQSDQPAGIAAKSLPALFSLPAIDENNQHIVGSSPAGILTTTLTGTDTHYLLHEQLSGHPLAASLERVLWQPGPQQGAILYAVTTALQTTAKDQTIELRLQQRNQQIVSLLSCTCTQFAWSPNGQMILYQTETGFTIFSLHDRSSYTVQAEQESVPYWSPDSRFLLLDGLNTLHLVQPAQHRDQILLHNAQQAGSSKNNGQALPASNALVAPVSTSSWASDSRHFLFVTHQRLSWQGRHLTGGEGLYTATLTENGEIQDQPAFVTGGNITQAGWMYQNPITSFLY